MDGPFDYKKTKNYQKSKILSGMPLYISPKMFENLQKDNYNFEIDYLKEESFSLGMILLELGLGKSI